MNVVVLKLLYHLSLDDRVKAMFAYTDCIPKVDNYLDFQQNHCCLGVKML